MAHMLRLLSLFLITVVGLMGVSFGESNPLDNELTIEELSDRLVIRLGEEELLHYVFDDSSIRRPYFAHVKTVQGNQVTRNHPPIKGIDSTDHTTMHPGIWMAFGDLSGEDFWRNKGSVDHVRFMDKPKVGASKAVFTEEKCYTASDGSEICKEIFRWKLEVLKSGLLMSWESTFKSDRNFFFGDQEEMGLGVRVATPMSEKSGGGLVDSEGRSGAKTIWSNSASWCDYRGEKNDRSVGITIFCHPNNFRPSWMHARNYGLVVANPFGRKAMGKGKKSQWVVQANESFILRYGVWIHDTVIGEEIDIDPTYQKYIQSN